MKNEKLLTNLVFIFLFLNAMVVSASEETKPITDTHNGLRIALETDKDSYYIGDEINITATLANFTRKTIIINSDTGWWHGPPGSIVWLTPEGKEIISDKVRFMGLVSKNYKEGEWHLPNEGSSSTYPSETIVIPAGRYTKQNCLHIAKQPGTPMLVANFHSDSSLDKPISATDVTWSGNIVVTKTIIVKNEIRPDILKTLKESESIILYSENPKKLETALGNLYKIGYPAKATILRLIRNPDIKKKLYFGASVFEGITYNLSQLAGEAFDEESYRELMKIACDTTNLLKVRLEAMWTGENYHFVEDVKVIIPPDFEKWIYQQIATLKNDKQKEIREKAIYILVDNKDALKRLGLESLLK